MSDTPNSSPHADVVVIGAGLGGLATAARLAAAGKHVIVCERSRVAGGRGRTRQRDGYALNLGPHALYAKGPAMQLLRELGVEPRGRAPKVRGVLLRDDHVHLLPATPGSTVSSSALTLRSKFGLFRFLAQIPRIDPEPLRELDCAAWLEQQFVGEDLRALIGGLIRLTTYCGELELLSADAALEQLRMAFAGGVLYLDGGWAQLVDALVERCRATGVELRLGARVESIARADTTRWAVEVDGAAIGCEQVVIAGSPQLADALLAPVGGDSGLVATHACTAAALDLGLRGPWPGPSFVLDLDEPIYLSVHSDAAALAPEHHTLLSLVWYRREQDQGVPAAELRRRLEQLVRRWMPGFEQQLVVEQFLPELTVAHDLPRPDRGGLQGRASTRAGEGVYLVGDWVGERGMLLDASMASAASVCAQILGEGLDVEGASFKVSA